MDRRLTTILAADMVGYSRLMAADEEGVIARLRIARADVIDPAIAEAGGRIVKTMGDGLLVEFGSPVAAVRAAVRVQETINAREDGPEESRIRFRVGVNTGDIVADGDDILGDAVNVAARLEGLAAPGGVCISRAVRDQIEARLDVDLIPMGPQKVKNIPEPVEAWRVEVAGAAEAPMQFALPDRPSIVVLPFANMSADPDQEYFCDGMTEDVTTALSRFSGLFVIARNTAFTFKGRNVDVREVSRALGVQYVLEGSVRLAGGRMRVTAQLVDAVGDRHVWAEKYDRKLEDIFDIQDELTEAIAMAVAPEIEVAEGRLNRAAPLRELGAWQQIARAAAIAWRMSPENSAEAGEILDDLLRRDADNVGALSTRASIYVLDSLFGWNRPAVESVRSAAETASRAIEVDGNDERALAVLGGVLSVQKRHQEAARALERAISINPNHSFAIGMHGILLTYLREFDRATELLEKAIRLSPRDPWVPYYVAHFGMRDLSLRKFESALAFGEQARGINPTVPSFLRLIASAQAWLGRLDDARATYARLNEMAPGLTLAGTRAAVQFAFEEDADIFCEGLRRAGMPRG